MTEQCEQAQAELNAVLTQAMTEKVNTLLKCDSAAAECPCTGTGAGQGDVDLILLIDSSGSMDGPAKDVEDAANAALANAVASCGASVEVTWLFVPGGDGITADSAAVSAGAFSQSHRKFLTDQGLTTPTYHESNAGFGESGGLAIADLAKDFAWREGACRSILYFTDTGIDGDSGAHADLARDLSIQETTANGVTVFVHNSGTEAADPAQRQSFYDEFIALTEATGGDIVIDVPADIALYERMLEQAVCHCGGGCHDVELLTAQPCISIRWGDSACDAFETDDLEKLYITVSNCYGNISFSNVSIGSVTVTDAADMPVAVLPDGTPSVDVLPIGPISFGEIPPCVNGQPSSISREFSIHTRGALEGEYKISLSNLCYEIANSYNMDACFAMKLCKS